MPFLPTLSLLLSVIVYGMLFRLIAWRTTLSVKALALMFGLGAVGATIATVYLQAIPMPFGDQWQFVAAWTTGPLFEELAKASPAILLMLSFRLSGRMSVADFALAGFMGGLGFQFVEDNFFRVISSDIVSGWSHVWGLGYSVSTVGDASLYWPGHYVYSGLVGLALGIGVRLWRDNPLRWLPGLAALAYAVIQHQAWNYQTMGAKTFSHWAPAYEYLAFALNGPLGLLVLPLAMVVAQIWETRLLARHAAAGEFALPDESGTALSEIGATARRAAYGRETMLRVVAFFRSRRAVALAEADAGAIPTDSVAPAFAALARRALVQARPLVLTVDRSPWLPVTTEWVSIAKTVLRRYRLPLILAVVSLLLFGIAPSLVVWLHGATMRAILVLAGAGFVAWRIIVYRRTSRPQPATTRGEALAVHRFQFALLCVSVATTALSLVSLFAHIKGMTPGSALYILGRFSRWGDWGGNLEALLALGAAWAAGLATPEYPDPDSAIDPVLLPDVGAPSATTEPAKPEAVAKTPVAPGDQLAMERVGSPAPGASAPAKTAEELEEEAYLAEAAVEEGPVDPNSPREIMRRAMAGDPDAQAQWEELKSGETASSRTDKAVMDSAAADALNLINPAAMAAYKEIGGAETLKEMGNLEWRKEVRDTAAALDTALNKRIDEVIDKGVDTIKGAVDLASMDASEFSAMTDQLQKNYEESALGKTVQSTMDGAVELSSLDADEVASMLDQAGKNAADKVSERVEQAQQLVDGMTSEEALGHFDRARTATSEAMDEAAKALEHKKQELWRMDPAKAREKLAEGTIAAMEEVVVDAAGEGLVGGLAKAGKAVDAMRGVDNALDTARAADHAVDTVRMADNTVDGARAMDRTADTATRAEATPFRSDEAPVAHTRAGPGDKPGVELRNYSNEVPPRSGPGDTQVVNPKAPGGINPAPEPRSGTSSSAPNRARDPLEDTVIEPPPKAPGDGPRSGPGDTQVVDSKAPGGIKPAPEPLPRGPYGEHKGPGHTQELDPRELPKDGKAPAGMNRQAPGDVPVSPTPKDGHKTYYDEAPYDDDPNIDPRTGKPVPPENDDDFVPLGRKHNPLDEAYVRIKGAEREVPSIGEAEEKIAGGRDAAIANAHQRYEDGLARARENLADPKLRERLDPDSLKELEDAVKPENARSLEDFRRQAGMNPTPPSRSGAPAAWSETETHVPGRPRDPLEDTVIEPPPKRR